MNRPTPAFLGRHHLKLPTGQRELAATVVGLGLGTGPGASASIIQNTTNTGSPFANNAKFGQSFTATATEGFIDAVSLQYFSFAPTGSRVSLVASMFAGEGFAGSPLATSASVVVPASTADQSFIEFTFTAILLTAGLKYSMQYMRTFTGSSGGGYARYGLNSSPMSTPSAGNSQPPARSKAAAASSETVASASSLQTSANPPPSACSPGARRCCCVGGPHCGQIAFAESD